MRKKSDSSSSLSGSVTWIVRRWYPSVHELSLGRLQGANPDHPPPCPGLCWVPRRQVALRRPWFFVDKSQVLIEYDKQSLLP